MPEGDSAAGPPAQRPQLVKEHVFVIGHHHVAAPLLDVRAAVRAEVIALGFKLTSEKVHLIRAECGSSLGVVFSSAKIPIRIRTDFWSTDAGHTSVGVFIEDGYDVVPLLTLSHISTLLQVFAAAEMQFNALMGRLDTGARVSVQPWIHGRGDVTPQAALVEREVADLKATSDDPSGLSGNAIGAILTTAVPFVTGLDYAEILQTDVDGMLVVGKAIAEKPGALPAHLVAQVRDAVATLEGDRTAGVVQLGENQRQALSFLHQQLKIRGELPLRILTVCTTCRHEQVINPDFVRRQKNSNRKRAAIGAAVSAVGSFSGMGGNPMAHAMGIVGKHPKFVCQRCQGMEADEAAVVFCPTCGYRHSDAVVLVCPKCKFDYRALAQAKLQWGRVGAHPVPADLLLKPLGTIERQADVHQSTGEPPQPHVPPAVPAGWHPDPSRRFEYRYWDGTCWTDAVSRGGQTTRDRLPS